MDVNNSFAAVDKKDDQSETDSFQAAFDRAVAYTRLAETELKLSKSDLPYVFINLLFQFTP